MYPTKNDLSETTRQNVIALLQKRLVEGLDLILQAKHAHWNVKGPHFIALHELFDRIHEELESGVDAVAERITQFGGIAEGTCQAVVKNTALPEYAVDIFNEEDHVSALSNSLSMYSKSLRQSAQQAMQWEDPATADILTAFLRTVDKHLWFVESHLAEEKVSPPSVKGAA